MPTTAKHVPPGVDSTARLVRIKGGFSGSITGGGSNAQTLTLYDEDNATVTVGTSDRLVVDYANVSSSVQNRVVLYAHTDNDAPAAARYWDAEVAALSPGPFAPGHPHISAIDGQPKVWCGSNATIRCSLNGWIVRGT